MKFETQQFSMGTSSIFLLEYSDFDPQELLDHLHPQELERYFSFASEKRKREFVATRYLREQLFGKVHIHYDSVGAPFIPQEGFISISHSDNCVGLMLSKNFKIALDLEDYSPQAKRLHTKFLSEPEKIIFDIESEQEMSICWSAKEVLYKLAGRKGIDFKSELALLSKQASESQLLIKGEIIQHGIGLTTEIHIFETGKRIVSFNSTALEVKNT